MDKKNVIIALVAFAAGVALASKVRAVPVVSKVIPNV